MLLLWMQPLPICMSFPLKRLHLVPCPAPCLSHECWWRSVKRNLITGGGLPCMCNAQFLLLFSRAFGSNKFVKIVCFLTRSFGWWFFFLSSAKCRTVWVSHLSSEGLASLFSSVPMSCERLKRVLILPIIQLFSFLFDFCYCGSNIPHPMWKQTLFKYTNLLPSMLHL